ncbi:MAG TPA: carbohydrate ABC transporter permease [Candidatus Mediterraneibacter cottocaccae]|nr:carbohydrate ABC transporter permease [Candidatus Mediterraneibacter cottocaccae]
MKIKKSRSQIIFNILGYTLVSLVAVMCLVPFIMMISGSVSDETLIGKYGYSILSRGFSLEAYSTIFKNPMQILNAYKNTILITVVGTAVALLVNAMTAYVLSRKDFKYRNKFAFFFYFTTLFNGGMVSTYIFMIRYYNLKDSYIALILPFVINAFYLLVMRSFMADIPVSLIESAKLDGAGEFTIFIKVILPLAKTGLATIGLFIALDYWNDWYNTMLYISDSSKFTLQYLLYNMLSSAEAMASVTSSVGTGALPTQTMKLAMAIVAAGPVIFVYPFVQKYFVKGITVGAVKG